MVKYAIMLWSIMVPILARLVSFTITLSFVAMLSYAVKSVVSGEVYGIVRGTCTLGPDVIIGKDVDFDCDDLELKSNDDFVFVRCGAGKFLYVKSEDRFFGDDNEEVKKIIRCLKL